MNITILGSGSFGLALAKSFNTNKITIWSKFQEEINNLKNKEYIFTTNLKEAINNSDIIIIAIPVEYINSLILEIKKTYQKGIILIASKGIDPITTEFPYQIIKEYLPNIKYGVLSGGTFAKDMIEENLMGITLATTYPEVIKITKKALINNNFLKLDQTKDLIGTSLCGSIKNIVAIASGILEGKKYPESTKFLFLTKALLETKNIIIKLKGHNNTILTYAGIDDFMMTCTSSKSRNYTLGKLIGENKNIEQYKKENTIEGLITTKALYTLLKKENIKSPLITTIYKILYQQESPETLITYLKN